MVNQNIYKKINKKYILNEERDKNPQQKEEFKLKRKI